METDPQYRTMKSSDDISNIVADYDYMLNAAFELHLKILHDDTITKKWDVSAIGAWGGTVHLEAKDSITALDIKMLYIRLKEEYDIDCEFNGECGLSSYSQDNVYYMENIYSDWENGKPWIEINSNKVVGCRTEKIPIKDRVKYRVICKSEQP